jgi:Flp pilus assembly CpaF family ATPase
MKPKLVMKKLMDTFKKRMNIIVFPIVGKKPMQTIMKPPPNVRKMTTLLKWTSASRMLKKSG